MSEGKKKVLFTRLGFGALLITGLTGVFCLDLLFSTNVPTTLLAVTVTSLGLWEFYSLAERKGLRPWKPAFSAAGGLLIVTQWIDLGAPSSGSVTFTAGALLGLLMLLFLLSLTRRQRATTLEDIAVTIMGLMYVWFLISFGFLLRNHPALPGGAGLWVTLMMVGTSKIGDIGAFFTGSYLGRRRLAPALSPKKTVEGAAGGLACSIGFAVAFTFVCPACGELFNLPLALVFGFAVGVLSQTGDLFESLLKRSVHAKDSGSVIPEFGGVLDLLDGVLFACPAAYMLVVLAR